MFNSHPTVSPAAPLPHQVFLPPSLSVLQPHLKEIFSPMGWVVKHLHPPCWQTGAPKRRQVGLCKGEPDHGLAILGSKHQPGTSFHFFTQRYLYSFQTKFSNHHLPTCFPTSSVLQRHSDKLILTLISSHAATNSDPQSKRQM